MSDTGVSLTAWSLAALNQLGDGLRAAWAPHDADHGADPGGRLAGGSGAGPAGLGGLAAAAVRCGAGAVAAAGRLAQPAGAVSRKRRSTAGGAGRAGVRAGGRGGRTSGAHLGPWRLAGPGLRRRRAGAAGSSRGCALAPAPAAAGGHTAAVAGRTAPRCGATRCWDRAWWGCGAPASCCPRRWSIGWTIRNRCRRAPSSCATSRPTSAGAIRCWRCCCNWPAAWPGRCCRCGSPPAGSVR